MADGIDGGDRITLSFPDSAITNTWLQVTVLANANTGLPQDEVFYFGNQIGETGNSTTDTRVNLADIGFTRDNQTAFTPAGIDSIYDFNRDTRINLADIGIARDNQTAFTSLRLITAPDGSNNFNLTSNGSWGDDNKIDDESSGEGKDLAMFAQSRFREESFEAQEQRLELTLSDDPYSIASANMVYFPRVGLSEFFLFVRDDASTDQKGNPSYQEIFGPLELSGEDTIGKGQTTQFSEPSFVDRSGRKNLQSLKNEPQPTGFVFPDFSSRDKTFAVLGSTDGLNQRRIQVL